MGASSGKGSWVAFLVIRLAQAKNHGPGGIFAVHSDRGASPALDGHDLALALGTVCPPTNDKKPFRAAGRAIQRKASYFFKIATALLAGPIIWIVGLWLNRRPGRRYIDAETLEEVEFGPRHTLFFIRMEYWGPLLVILTLVSIAVQHIKGG